MRRLIMLFLTILTLLMLLSCGDDNKTRDTELSSILKKYGGEEKSSNYSSATYKWYEGGNLHSVKISEWEIATYRNKLATCADFMAKTDNTISMEELKRRATNLVRCIDNAGGSSNDKVSTVAAICVKSMGY